MPAHMTRIRLFTIHVTIHFHPFRYRISWWRWLYESRLHAARHTDSCFNDSCRLSRAAKLARLHCIGRAQPTASRYRTQLLPAAPPVAVWIPHYPAHITQPSPPVELLLPRQLPHQLNLPVAQQVLRHALDLSQVPFPHQPLFQCDINHKLFIGFI